MKTVLKFIPKLLLFITFLMLTNCSKEEFQEQIKSSKNKNDISFEQFKNETGLTNFASSITIRHNISSAKTSDGKVGPTDFDIDTDIIKRLELNSKITYTFRITPKDKSSEKSIFNLTLHEKEGIWQMSIVEFIPTDQNYEDLKNGVTNEVKGTIKLLYESTTETIDGWSTCYTITITSYHCVGCTGECDLCHICMSVQHFTFCVDDEDGDSTAGDGGITIGDGNSTSGGGGNDNGTGTGSSPNNGTGDAEHAMIPNLEHLNLNPDDTVDSCTRSFLDGLAPTDKTWLYAHNDDYNNIKSYIAGNGNCDEANAAAAEIVKQLKKGGKVDFVNKIIIDSSFANNQKAMCVYNKMRDINAFNKALAPFEAQSPKAFLKLKTDDLGNNGTRAVTLAPDSNNIITTTINNNLFSIDGINGQPNVMLAQTIIHEVIHAEFYREIMDALSVGSYSDDPDLVRTALMTSDYERLSNYFRLGHDWQHSYMADHYRNAIARVTQEFATGIPVIGTPDPLYSNLAWRGLMNYGLVTAWTQIVGADPNNESTAAASIRNTIEAYINSNANQTCQ